MKKHEIIFSIVRIPFDFLIMYGAFFLAKEIRLITDGIPGVVLPIQTIDAEALSIFWFFGALLYISLFAIHKLYTINLAHSKIAEILDIIRYGVYWFVFFAVWVYLWNGIIYSGSEIPRLIILFSMVLAIFWSSLVRVFLNFLQTWLLKKWHIPKRNILLISNISQEKLRPIIHDIQLANIYHVAWYANPKKQNYPNLSHFSDIESIESLMIQRRCDEILFLESDFPKEKLYEVWELSRIYGVRYRYITNSFDITKTNTSLGLIHKTPVIELSSTPLENWRRVIKRLFDILGSIGILTLSFPFLCMIALLIKIEDRKGPVIYKNLRIGQSGKVFHCYKFRYLQWKYCVKESYWVKNNDDPAIAYEKKLISEKSTRNGPLYKIKEDPRKTKIGYFLEKYSLDELPQFLNVLKWEMSIVGPRPHQPREVEQYKKYQKRLLTIKPWITGMAQVNGREENNFEKEAELDIFYIENWSFLLDLKIMLKTLSILFNRK